jgi:ketosteroid isomerase-like protein
MEYDVLEPGGDRHAFRARATMVFASEDAEWLIVHEHFSPFIVNS